MMPNGNGRLDCGDETADQIDRESLDKSEFLKLIGQGAGAEENGKPPAGPAGAAAASGTSGHLGLVRSRCGRSPTAPLRRPKVSRRFRRVLARKQVLQSAVGRIGNPSLAPGRIGNPSYERGELILARVHSRNRASFRRGRETRAKLGTAPNLCPRQIGNRSYLFRPATMGT
jgi:hypothetical protein